MDLKIMPQTVLHLATSKLREAILSGVFQPGARLTEADLCERMGVSRASIREALRSLAAEKLITIVPNRGPSVTTINWEEAQEIYHVRAMLEGEAAFLAASKLTKTDIAAMRVALAEFEQAVKQNNAAGRLAATGRFYEVILTGCGNRVIHELLQGLVARINFLRARSMSRPGRVKHSVAEMRKILTALEKRDARAARAAAVEHVRLACEAAREGFHSKKAA